MKILHIATNWDEDGNVLETNCGVDEVQYAIEDKNSAHLFPTLTNCVECFHDFEAQINEMTKD